jgi:protein-L-isoaspartate(D-aspartate) O-methyltransferase
MTMTATETTFETERRAMVASQLRPNMVTDQRIVLAMATIPREAFVPEASRALAYRDTLVPLGAGRYVNLPISTGRLLTEADLEPSDRVLLIGAGGGYAAAVLATVVAEVVAVESQPEALAIARAALQGAGNVRLVDAPLEAGCPEAAPYDVLLVDGVVEHLPDALVEQVRPGGRVVTGIMERGVARLAAGRRTAGFAVQPFVDYDSAPLPGFAVPKRFQF